MPIRWTMKGALLGACNCDWGCPCSFNARPTHGKCEGGYIWHTEEGKFGDVPIGGLTLAWVAHSPGPLHEGKVTSLLILDEKATAAQRDALLKVTHGKYGGPWAIFASVTETWLEPRSAKFDIRLDGLKSRAGAVGLLELELGPILNPVTGKPEELYLDKPTGFTSTRATICKSEVFRVTADLRYDHSGQYAEFSHFHYAGEGEG